MSVDEMWALDATDQAACVRRGEVSATELVEASLARIEQLDGVLGSVVACDADRALAQAASCSGPFAGVPTLAKDLLAYPGLPAAMGSRLFAGNVPTDALPYTDAIDRAGLVVVGKSATSEFGLLGSTETLQAGITRNPWGAELSAGGSSGGAVAAVAAGLVPVAHASDGGGSIRGPASLAGLVGFKPSRGATARAVPMVTPFSASISEHFVTRSVRDSDALLALTAPRAREPYGPGDGRPLRIGVYDTSLMGRRIDAEGAAALAHAVAVCTELGHDVRPMPAPPVSGEEVGTAFFTMAGAAMSGMRQMLAPMLGGPFGPEQVEPFTWALIEWYDAQPMGAMERAMGLLGHIDEVMRGYLAEVDVAVCPTILGPRPHLGHLAPHLPFEVIMERTEALAGFTAVHNPAGAPAMTLPLHWTDDGLPVGVMFAAAHGADARLFRLAYQLEQAAPWASRWPAFARTGELG
ncbi:MAG: amidase [Deltaproteobacteria bacterium]|nr:MAG: amidase [Deltaproteobacteria bacterium]